VEAQVVDSVARIESADDPITQSLERLFQAASYRIVMETPYFVLTADAAAMLARTGARGVDMAVLTNSPVSTDNALSQVYFQRQWPRLLAEVPRLRLFVGGTTHNIHSKLAVFDDRVTLLGSYNVDPFSMLVNGEIMIAVWSPAFAADVSERTLARIAQGPPAVYEYTIQRDASGEPVRSPTGEVAIAFGPRDHAGGLPRIPGVQWVLLRVLPWLARFPPLY
jgi:phosphatidylserine/phosphatidylglycerophosphate/cardiolipin synthase-like enzyme